MKIYNISIKSLARRKTKTFFLVFSLTLAVSSIASLIQVSMLIDENLENELDVFGANIIITPNREELSLNYGGLSFGNITYQSAGLKETDLQKIDSIKNRKNLATIAPKFFHVFQIDKTPVMFAGVDFNNETKLKKWWELMGRVPKDSNEVIIGSRVASKFNFGINDIINVNNYGFKIAGIIKSTGSQDDDLVFANMDLIQKISNKPEELSLIEISALCYDCPIEEIVRQTSEKLPNANVSSVKKTIDSKKGTLAKFKSLAAGVSSLILMISILMVFSNVNASMIERVKEIGVYKAIGFENNSILKIVFFEIGIASLIAGVIGYGIGAFLSAGIYSLLNEGSELLLIFDIRVFMISLAISLLVGLIASLLPAYRSSKLDPTVAFRNL